MYIDPSVTSYIIQVIAGVVITCGVVIGVFWKKIKAWFAERKVKRLEKQLHDKYDKP